MRHCDNQEKSYLKQLVHVAILIITVDSRIKIERSVITQLAPYLLVLRDCIQTLLVFVELEAAQRLLGLATDLVQFVTN